MAESIVAKSSIPWARRASMACSFVVPAGRACETTPSKTTFVARPSTFGAMTARATEAAVATRIAAIQLRWAVSSPIMRLNEGQNAFAFPGGGQLLLLGARLGGGVFVLGAHERASAPNWEVTISL